MALQWYRRLADVPSIAYQGDPTVKRTQLAGHDVRPTIDTTEYEGQRREYITWHGPNGGHTSWPPTRAWVAEAQPHETPAQTELRQLHERLELPGMLADYEWALTTCIGALWGLRGDEPWVVHEVERLCWLDIAIIEAYPSTVAHERGDGTFIYYGGVGFRHLIDLFESNGYLWEAIELVQRAAHVNLPSHQEERLRTRLAALEYEDVV